MPCPFAQIQVSLGGGPFGTGAVVAAFGETVALQATSTAGWTSAVWELPDYPPGLSCPAGWSTAANGTYFFQPSNPTTPPPPFTLPFSGTADWGKIPVRLRINGNPPQYQSDGEVSSGFNPSFTDTATVLTLHSPILGMEGLGATESTQFDAMRSWPGGVMRMLRALDASALRLSAINFFPYVDVSNAISGGVVCDGPGFTPTTAGVRFMPHIAGSVIIGMRFVWIGNVTANSMPVTCSLWNAAGSKVATVTTGNIGNPSTPIIATAMFGTPYTVLAADVDLPCIISTYSFYSGTGGGWYVETGWHGTPLGSANLPIFASPLFSYGDGPSGDHSMGNVFGVTTQAGSETLPATEFGVSRYFAMEPIFQ